MQLKYNHDWIPNEALLNLSVSVSEEHFLTNFAGIKFEPMPATTAQVTGLKYSY